jgi:hypothetical protein
MCSPSDPCSATANSPPSGLINNNITPRANNLQSNQQEHSTAINTITTLDTTSSIIMPIPPSPRNRSAVKEMPLKAYKKSSSLATAGQHRISSTKPQPSYEHNFKSGLLQSPCSTSGIWTDRSNTAAPDSPPQLDYLRDIDLVLTPCTTLSTVPSRTPSEEEFEQTWRKSLEIPDLEYPMNSPTAVAQEPSNPYYKKTANKVGSPSHRGTTEFGHRSTTETQGTPQSRSVQTSRESTLPRRKTSVLASPHPRSPNSTLQQALTPNRSTQEYRSQHDYYGKPHQVYAVHHSVMQGQYYYNQRVQQQNQRVQHQHHQRQGFTHEPPRSPRFKNRVLSPVWTPHSPRPNIRNTPHVLRSPTTPNSRQSHGSHQRPHQASSTHSGQSSVGGARPTYEILKTLLRKKACLYEPGTSRAIALITWLVGRKLALSNGYFSRQHLQSGVHAVVGNKIDSGMITRTKVNRCMQIILNSCFHYIIPRPDGTEEKGDLFRQTFAKKVSDDSYLLQSLPHPWDDLKITEDCLIDRGDDGKDSSDKFKEEEKGSAKRVVLLCFNENVRSAEDVLRCHNDFIRDAAITGDLHLSAQEWRQFFSLKDDDGDSSNVGASSPILRPVGGCDIPYLKFDSPPDTTLCLAVKDTAPEPWARCADSLGQMSNNELGKFRTTWCCKRYDHDHTLCRFAHVDTNEGWLRRNPFIYKYSEKKCPHVTFLQASTTFPNGCHLNTCSEGQQCEYAHSQEEIDYHPRRYKSTTCTESKFSHFNCKLRDICPMSHLDHPSTPVHLKPARTYGKRKNDSPRGKGGHTVKHSSPNANKPTESKATHMAAPIIYHKPAPPSEFEKTLLFPGLQSLYRRNCAMFYAQFLGKETPQKYSIFADNWDEVEEKTETEEVKSDSFSLYSTIGGK